METEKTKKDLLPTVLLILAGIALLWAAMGVAFPKRDAQREFNDAEYQQALDAEDADKCATPDGYTDKEWREHMSHHPSRYGECFGEENSAEYQNITPEQLETLLAAQGETVTLIDTHIPEQAHIPGTDAFIPFNVIADRQGELPDDPDALIVLYCRSGSMSVQASEALTALGYRNVYNLVGGTNAWTASGRAVRNEAL